MSRLWLRFVTPVIACTLVVMGLDARAQDWPSKPVRLIVPFAPGGGADVTARLLTPLLSQTLKQQVIVDNRGGGGGVIGAAAVATAPADGYTVLYGTPGQLVTNQYLMKRLPYDPEKDFAPVTLLFRSPYALVVNPAVPARTLRELIALAKAHPGKIGFATSGIGSVGHLAAELFRAMAGIEIVHVPYRGTGPAVQDVIAGQMPMMVDSTDILTPQIQANKLRALGVTSAERQKVLPGVPAIAEILPGYEATAFNYIAVRAGTPRPIILRLNEAIHAALREPIVLERFAAAGKRAEATSPEGLGDILKAERVKWRDIIARAGIQPE
ncbi:MAG TPA: tripartite tricarboxylate transporter substrate binding protein [Burkholderiales bacterium]|nr:tripartite tricarboxylate transporter substrate binding protein [Burkholderiales bacterium]